MDSAGKTSESRTGACREAPSAAKLTVWPGVREAMAGVDGGSGEWRSGRKAVEAAGDGYI